MTDEHVDELVSETEEPKGFLSLRDQIRAEREELKQETTLDLVVPGYESIGVRYRGIPERDLEKFVKALGKSKEGLRASYDLLIRCCETILVRAEEDGDLEPLEDDDGEYVKFDQRLADFLGFDSDTARNTVIQVFSPDGAQTLAPFEHATAVLGWMQGKGAEIDPALLGE